MIELIQLATEYIDNGAFPQEGKPEASTRQYLINPFLSLLGWESSPSSEYHFVSEYSGGMSRKWEDIVLLKKDMPLVFIECKNLLSEDIFTTYNINELLNYIKEYNRVNKFGHRVDWGILTNFRKLYVFYVSDKKPFLDFNYETYIDDLDFIKELFSIDGIEKDGLAHYYSENNKEELGELFLQDLKKWRLIVANGFYDNDDSLSIDIIKSVSQQFINRLIFIRMLETLGIIPYNWLRSIYIQWREGIIGLNKSFLKVIQEEFTNIESLYDTELFIRSLVDDLDIKDDSLNELLKIEGTMNPTIARKIGQVGSLKFDDKGLYGYNFKTLSIDIMGTAYERYLAHNIIIIDNSIRIEETKELRKKEGIYYTPKHIVDYIIDKTTTPFLNDILLQSKSLVDEGNYTEAKLKIETIKDYKILDPACGSGSFLISAFDKIFETYTDYNKYVHEKVRELLEKGGLDEYLSTGHEGFQVVSIGENILLDNLYGVDYDPQAVEITKLNLWLRMLSTSPEIYRPEIGHTKRKYLPSLDLQIKCGNSICTGVTEENMSDAAFISILKQITELRSTSLNLILKTTPVYSREVDLTELLQEIDEVKGELEALTARIRQDLNNSLIERDLFEEGDGGFLDLAGSPFHWELEYPEIFLNGGFSVVIGNPPHGAEFTSVERNYIEKTFSLGSGTKNSAYIFIELSRKYLNNAGYLGLVLPKSLLFSQDWEKVRDYLLTHTNIRDIVDISKAFKDVLLEQVILISIINERTSSYDCYSLNDDEEFIYNTNVSLELCNQTRSFPVSIDELDLQIYNKMMLDSISFGDITETCRGFPYQRRLSRTRQETFEPTLKGADIKRFTYEKPSNYLSNVELTTKAKYPKMRATKLISQRIVAHIENPVDHIAIMSCIDFHGNLNVDTVENTVLINESYNYHYLLGLLNSRLIGWFAYKFIFCNAIRTMDFDEYYVNKICLKPINDDTSLRIDEISDNVANMIILCEQNNWLFNSLISLQNTFSLTDELTLEYYWNINRAREYGIDLTTIEKIDDSMEGIIKEYVVILNENTIEIKVKISEDPNLFNALSFNVNDQVFKNYLYLNLKSQEGKKTYRSRKQILRTLYSDFKILLRSPTKWEIFPFG